MAQVFMSDCNSLPTLMYSFNLGNRAATISSSTKPLQARACPLLCLKLELLTTCVFHCYYMTMTILQKLLQGGLGRCFGDHNVVYMSLKSFTSGWWFLALKFTENGIVADETTCGKLVSGRYNWLLWKNYVFQILQKSPSTGNSIPTQFMGRKFFLYLIDMCEHFDCIDRPFRTHVGSFCTTISAGNQQCIGYNHVPHWHCAAQSNKERKYWRIGLKHLLRWQKLGTLFWSCCKSQCERVEQGRIKAQKGWPSTLLLHSAASFNSVLVWAKDYMSTIFETLLALFLKDSCRSALLKRI